MMTQPDSPLSILREAIRLDKPGLIDRLERDAVAHMAFTRQATNKAAVSAALDLAKACDTCAQLIADDRLIDLLMEVRTQVPALHAARTIIREKIK